MRSKRANLARLVAGTLVVTGGLLAGHGSANAAVTDYNWQNSSNTCWGTYGSGPGSLQSQADLVGGTGAISCWVRARVQCRANDTTRAWFEGGSVGLAGLSTATCSSPYNVSRPNVGARYAS